MKITCLRNSEIDYKAYDFCVENSSQGTIYAMSWYLDIVSPGWELLMADDYHFVMPLPVKKKFFIKYAAQPPLCQQLGVFSLEKLTDKILLEFIKQIPYAYYYLQFNMKNLFPSLITNQRDNYILNLNKPYEIIKNNYSSNCIRNIKKANKQDIVIEKKTDIEFYLSILKNNSEKVSLYKDTNNLRLYLNQLNQQNTPEIWSAYEKDIITPLSCVYFYQWTNRVYYFLPVSTLLGKSKQSMFFLLDQFIQEKSNKDLVLDFEGSSVKSIAYFYEGFGASNYPYPCLKKSLNIKNFIYAKKNI